MIINQCPSRIRAPMHMLPSSFFPNRKEVKTFMTLPFPAIGDISNKLTFALISFCSPQRVPVNRGFFFFGQISTRT